MTLIILCPYHLIRRFTRAMYIGTTVLVLVVWVFNRAEGVKAWLDIIWDMTIQPSEFIKLAMILMLAQRLSQSEHPMSTFRDFIEIMAMLLVPCAIILFSGETGSAIVVVYAAVRQRPLAAADYDGCRRDFARSGAVRLHGRHGQR